MRTAVRQSTGWIMFQWRKAICLIVADLAVNLRRVAAVAMPVGHPLREFEESMVVLLWDAERLWFRHNRANENPRTETPPRKHHPIAWATFATGLALMLAVGIGVKLATGSGLETQILRAAEAF